MNDNYDITGGTAGWVRLSMGKLLKETKEKCNDLEKLLAIQDDDAFLDAVGKYQVKTGEELND